MKLSLTIIVGVGDDRLTWNQKNLDYEIETATSLPTFLDTVFLETKRTSITRLKQDAPSCRIIITWNQKNLDYEIETLPIQSAPYAVEYAWNQKNLDYEIETVVSSKSEPHWAIILKPKEPRLRDWNHL